MGGGVGGPRVCRVFVVLCARACLAARDSALRECRDGLTSKLTASGARVSARLGGLGATARLAEGDRRCTGSTDMDNESSKAQSQTVMTQYYVTTPNEAQLLQTNNILFAENTRRSQNEQQLYSA